MRSWIIIGNVGNEEFHCVYLLLEVTRAMTKGRTDVVACVC